MTAQKFLFLRDYKQVWVMGPSGDTYFECSSCSKVLLTPASIPLVLSHPSFRNQANNPIEDHAKKYQYAGRIPGFGKSLYANLLYPEALLTGADIYLHGSRS